jgi:hypothetical protein
MVRIVKRFRFGSFVLCRSKISGFFFFYSMDLGMFDRVCPSLKTRELIDERRFDMSRSDKNSERYVIPMHRKNVWTNKWIPERIYCRLAPMILVCSTEEVGDHLKERED